MRYKFPTSIYIHLPFCKTKCPYCDFASFAFNPEEQKLKRQSYIQALVKEIDLRCLEFFKSKERYPLKTIFFGGGTPSVHDAEELKLILDRIKIYFDFSEDIEITLEANPGTVNKQRLAQFKDIGINRISLGAQTFDEELLIKLGRGHSLDDTYQMISDLKDLKFKSWSFDLIYGLPKQSLESWAQTLDIGLSYEPPHISAYALSIEQNTPYGEIYKNSQHKDLPVEETIVEMYNLANHKFKEKNLYRYETSNWALAGHEAKHNLCYWLAEEYFAFGLSAHGYLNSIRYANTRDLDLYTKSLTEASSSTALEAILASSQKISPDESLEEEIMLKLRLEQGLSLRDEIKAKINTVKLDNLIKAGFFEISDTKLKLKDKGVLLSNRLIAEILN